MVGKTHLKAYAFRGDWWQVLGRPLTRKCGFVRETDQGQKWCYKAPHASRSPVCCLGWSRDWLLVTG